MKCMESGCALFDVFRKEVDAVERFHANAVLVARAGGVCGMFDEFDMCVRGNEL